MPLLKSSSESAFKKNVADMRNAGHPRDQSLAAAYDNQRRAKAKGMAGGGMAPIPGGGIPAMSGPAGAMSSAPAVNPAAGLPSIHMHGLIQGPGTGRSDSLHLKVPKGGYMVPADVVSGIGHGSSLSGANALDHSFPRDIRTPEGRAHVRGFAPLMKRPFGSAFGTGKGAGKGKFAQGGDTGELTDIMGSDGEYFIHPDAIEGKYGNLKRGHRILDHWVQIRRKTNIREQKNLKIPKGAKKI